MTNWFLDRPNAQIVSESFSKQDAQLQVHCAMVKEDLLKRLEDYHFRVEIADDPHDVSQSVIKIIAHTVTIDYILPHFRDTKRTLIEGARPKTEPPRELADSRLGKFQWYIRSDGRGVYSSSANNMLDVGALKDVVKEIFDQRLPHEPGATVGDGLRPYLRLASGNDYQLTIEGNLRRIQDALGISITQRSANGPAEEGSRSTFR
jgi:hypothetical protein